MRPMRGQRGQVAPLVAAILAVAGLFVVALGRLGAEVWEEASVQAVADAAALAGASAGADAASDVAAANGSELVAFAEADPFVQVEVRRDGRTARATAELIPAPSKEETVGAEQAVAVAPGAVAPGAAAEDGAPEAGGVVGGGP